LKRAKFAVPFRYIDPPVRHGFIPACFQGVPYCRKKGSSPGLFDVLERLAIDTGCASVPLGCTVSLFEGLDLSNMHEQTPEAM
jgi:hypothetical protein